MESETTSKNISYQYIQTHGAILNLKGSFTHERFCAVIYWPFGKHRSSGLGSSSKCEQSHRTTRQNHIYFTTELIREVRKYCEVVWLMVLDTRFPKFCFSLENSNFIIGNHSCFPGHDSLSSFIFEKIPVKYPSLNKHGLSVTYCFL